MTFRQQMTLSMRHGHTDMLPAIKYWYRQRIRAASDFKSHFWPLLTGEASSAVRAHHGVSQAFGDALSGAFAVPGSPYRKNRGNHVPMQTLRIIPWVRTTLRRW